MHLIKHQLLSLLIFTCLLSVFSCNPDEEDTPPASTGNGNNGGNNGGNTTGSAHSCGAQNVHNPNLTYGTMTDQEGNVYKTIVIGTQEWMAENLNTSIYRNGDSIPTNLSNDEWNNTINTQQGAWVYYNNDESYACPYGKLYNWYATVDSRQLCPTGWHVPSDAEWSVLTTNLGGEGVAGGQLKGTGTSYWTSPNTGASNSSGFSGLPGGYLYVAGGYNNNVGDDGYWWSSTQSGPNVAWSRSMFYYGNIVYSNGSGSSGMQAGFSVRCLRD